MNEFRAAVGIAVASIGVHQSLTHAGMIGQSVGMEVAKKHPTPTRGNSFVAALFTFVVVAVGGSSLSIWAGLVIAKSK